MAHLASLDLIRLFDFYLAAMFVIGSVRRYSLYRHTAGIAFAFPGRWPHLFKLMRSHHAVLLTWRTFLPSIMTLVIWILHTLASRLIWHDAQLTVRELISPWTPALIVVPLGCAMMALDIYFLIVVGKIDRPMLETYFDQAEFERSVPADWAQRYGSIYALACNLCLQATGHWLTKWDCSMRVGEPRGRANHLIVRHR
jgi:hypothetical protein